jgi:hypothetical protein
VVLLA